MKKMKFIPRYITMVLLVTGAGMAGAQDLMKSDVPSEILTNFEKDFNKARDVEWEKEGDLYKVDFEHKRRIDMEVWYQADGSIFRQEEEWKKSKLPDVVKESIAAEFPDYRIGDITRITEDGLVQYEVDLDSSTRSDLDVWIDAEGKVLDSRLD